MTAAVPGRAPSMRGARVQVHVFPACAAPESAPLPRSDALPRRYGEEPTSLRQKRAKPGEA